MCRGLLQRLGVLFGRKVYLILRKVYSYPLALETAVPKYCGIREIHLTKMRNGKLEKLHFPRSGFLTKKSRENVFLWCKDEHGLRSHINGWKALENTNPSLERVWWWQEKGRRETSWRNYYRDFSIHGLLLYGSAIPNTKEPKAIQILPPFGFHSQISMETWVVF